MSGTTQAPALSPVPAATPSDILVVWQNGVAKSETVAQLIAAPALLNGLPIGQITPSSGSFTTLVNSSVVIDGSVAIFTPLTGTTVTIPSTAARAIINPAGTIAALTVTAPTAPTNPTNSVQPLKIWFTKAVTTLTWTGWTVVGSALPSSAAIGNKVELEWSASLAAWLHGASV